MSEIGNWTKEQCKEARYEIDEDGYNICWDVNDLEINENGMVEGQLISAPVEGPDAEDEYHEINVHVESNTYGDNDEKVNYVPVVNITKDGSIKKNGNPKDSSDPQKAIENGKSRAEFYFNNPESTRRY